MKRFLLFLLVVGVMTACAPRGVIQFATQTLPTDVTIQPVFVATNRLRSETGQPGLFGQEFGEIRDPELRFARMDVSIPPGHELGEIEWPHKEPLDPTHHFVVHRETGFHGADAFLQDLQSRQSGRDVVVFVHGFNVTNAEAVYRLAQIAHDFQSQIPVIAFSWPSAGSAQGYAYDRDSVIFSRDGLEELLTALAMRGNQTFIVAHSMGGQLVMETLRQMSLSGKQRSLDQLAGVALISPDIDEDVFLQQAARINPFPQPFSLMVSTRDRALGLAAFVTGKERRLGSITEPERLGDLPVDIIDLSDVEGGDRAGHATAFTAPAAIRLLRRLQARQN